MATPCRLLLWQVALRLSYHVASGERRTSHRHPGQVTPLVTHLAPPPAGLCPGGADIFVRVSENSPTGQLIATLSVAMEPGANAVRLCLTGAAADWFYLEGRTIRLNSSASRVLDREVLGSVLIAELTCSEDDVIQSRSRILVEILNQNDNRPAFLEETLRPVAASELTAVNSVVFTVKATDADGDMISYIIDESSPDARFFRIDLPNSGDVVLDKPLDYETRTRLQVTVWAQETNTLEEFNTSAVLTLDIQDGDDQYPHFLPCTPVSSGVPVCLSPAYTANITHKQQEAVVEFSPGPIRAQDGDRGIDTPLLYSILSGDDHGRFVMNNRTGGVRLTRPVNRRQVMTNFTLVVMVCQEDDRLKFSVASVLIRVLSQNLHPPVFNSSTYKGFVIQSSSPASIVSTYGNQVLVVQVSDQDFSDGLNLNIHYWLRPPSGLYQVTQQGVLIARTDRLHAFDRHVLQVVARDQESGEEVWASLDIEVLQRGQPVPRGAFTEQPLFGGVDGRLAGGIVGTVLLLFLSSILFLLLRTTRRRRPPTTTDEHSTVAVGQHLNVVTSSRPLFPVDESSYTNQPSGSEGFQGRQGVYTRRHSQLPPPSSSSSPNIIIISDPGSRPRLDPGPLAETPGTRDTLRVSDVTEELEAPGGEGGARGGSK
ncbi:cadherin-related family member 5 isoform X2 [Antennarius striatus]|uniref:cadherin-related family member 5 isoform X2 n=1 Tax=Antennarius striatus TaxID=241820 RepID=UPI0035B4DF76